MNRLIPLFALALAGLQGCALETSISSGPSGGTAPASSVGIHPGGILTSSYHGTLTPKPGDELAMFAMGCFWGSEATYRKVKGVTATAVGFSGGTTVNPTYDQVCTGSTHHAESVLVEFDPKKVTYSQLLEVFWASHDPTTVDQQGPDYGEQYRSAIYYFSPEQKTLAEQTLAKEQKTTEGKIVTQIKAAGPFYAAELYHQQYAAKTGHDACPPPRRKVHGVGMGG